MDKMVHTALNSLKMILQNQQITSQNISNASVVGYRRDSNSEFGTAYLNSEEGLNTRECQRISNKYFNRYSACIR